MAVYKDQNELLNTDWQAKINEAAKAGDYKLAAQYEQARNDKINSSAYTGKINQTTSNYAGWIDGNDYAAVAQQQMANGASAEEVLETYNNRLNKASSTVGMEKYLNDEHMQAMLDYISSNMGATEKPTFDYGYYEESKPTYESSYSARIDQLLNEILNRDNFSYDVAAPTYNDTYSGKIADQAAVIENYGKFSYDMANDPMYQQYAAQYQREGTRAMNDTLASVASGAGGMNSYAVTAAQQANNYYNAQLNDKIPELAQLAYEMYLQDFDREMDELSMLRSLGETEYNRYRDDLSDYRTERQTAYQQYLDEIDNQVRNLGLLEDMDATQYSRYRDTMNDWRNDRDFAYGAYRDDVGDYQYDQEWEHQLEREAVEDTWREKEWDYGVAQDTLDNEWREKEWNYGVEQDKIANDQNASNTAYDRILDMISLGVMPSDETLAAAGISSAEVAAMVEEVKKQNAGQVVSNPGGGGDDTYTPPKNPKDPKKPASGYDNGSRSFDEVREMQNYYEVEADGYWGENSRKAAGGMSADEAWAEYQQLAGKKKQDRETFNTSALRSSEAASHVDTLYNIGAVDIDDDNNIVWADGWDASNWHEKVMDEMNEDIARKLGLIQ